MEPDLIVKGSLKNILSLYPNGPYPPITLQVLPNNGIPATSKNIQLTDNCTQIQALNGTSIKVKEMDIIKLLEYTVEKFNDTTTILFITSLSILKPAFPNKIISPLTEISINRSSDISASFQDYFSEEEFKSPIRQINSEIPIKALGLLIKNWKIKVMLIRKNPVHSFNKKNGQTGCLMALEFVDKENMRISATLFGDGIKKYGNLLNVNEYYTISGGTVKVANRKYTDINNEFTLILDETSIIKPIPNDGSIQYKYGIDDLSKFIDISTILTKIQSKTLLNIIGIIHSTDDLREIKLTTGEIVKSKIIAIFDDSCKDAIRLSLWRDLAEQNYKINEIIAMKSVVVKEFKEKKMLMSTNNSMFLPILENTDKIQKLKNLYFF